MGITISVHARGQAADRGITEAGIRELLAGGTVSMPSKTDPEAAIVLGHSGGKVWGVVLNVYTLNVITVRRASRKERRIYEQKKED
jgi:uncharacterized DUF497 family protein